VTPRNILSLPHNNVLAVSHENLDLASWSFFGNLIRYLKIPRLTFWPQTIDPEGFRFPYWWNYIKNDRYDINPNFYNRYGRAVDINKLLQPLDGFSNARKNAVCVLTRHLNYPRNYQIDQLSTKIDVDIFMSPLNEWSGNKYELISKYKYVFAAENSCGYGYETEKMIEAIDAGCVPVGYVNNPLGNFNDFTTDDLEMACLNAKSKPLLNQNGIPDFEDCENYIRNKFQL
jgi:hypothetical protein